MAVGRMTAAAQRHDRSGVASGDTPGPVRTCVGCRRSVPASELLRVVISPSEAPGPPVADVARRRGVAGRGAWLHCDPGCMELAQRRRAFGRALRVPTVDTTAVAEYVSTHSPSSSGTSAGDETT